MATSSTSVPEKDVKAEGENMSRKEGDKQNEVKVTNLLSEIRTTDLPKESPMQVDKEAEKEPKDSSKDEGKLKDIDNRIKEEKVTEDKGEKKEEEAKKASNGGKVAEEVKKTVSGEKKADDAKNVEKGGKKLDDNKKTESGEKKKESSPKSPSKSKKESPLAAYFQDWDKFTTEQKIEIEKFIKEKVDKMGASSKVKPGVRTFTERERNWFRRNAMMRRRREAALRNMEARDRYRPPNRYRGAGDTRYRSSRDDRIRRRYSPRREELPWRSPWAPMSSPVDSLLKQMERFVQMVDKFPKPNSMNHGEPKRLALLPTPPNGYMSSRANGLHNDPMVDKSLLSPEKTYGPPRWAVPQFPVNGEDPTRRFFRKEPTPKPWKQRPSPYNNRTAYPSTVLRSDRERNFSQSKTVTPFQESRYKRGRN